MGLAQFPDQFTDADDLRRVQADRGLIQNDQLRAAQKSLRNAHALAVALGQAADEPGHHLIQPGAPGGLLHLLAALGFFDPLELGRKVQIFLHGHFRVQRRLLRQVAHTGFGLLRLLRQGKSCHLHFPAGGGQVAGQDVHNGGFARAVGAQQPIHLPVRHGKGQIPDGRMAAVILAQMRYFDHSNTLLLG